MIPDALFFPYRFDRFVAPILRPLGVRPERDGVWVSGERLLATFGRFRVDVPTTNLAAAEVTGPYLWIKAIGPRGSLADHGLTFGTSTRGGTLITFAEPIPRVVAPWDHPNITLTVVDPRALADRVRDVAPPPPRGTP